MNTEPPDLIVTFAIHEAQKSPCSKSQRGAIVYDTRDLVVHGSGFNGPPEPFRCTGSDACREHCNKSCLHAEARALQGLARYQAHYSELVHAKTVQGELVAGGGPSCWQCSRQILELQLHGVWLFQAQQVRDVDHAGMFPRVTARAGEPGRWHFYTALEFHQATLRACGVPGADGRGGFYPSGACPVHGASHAGGAAGHDED